MRYYLLLAKENEKDGETGFSPKIEFSYLMYQSKILCIHYKYVQNKRKRCENATTEQGRGILKEYMK